MNKFSSLGKAIKSKERHRKVNFFHIPIPKVINLFLFTILLVFQLSWSPLLSNIKVFWFIPSQVSTVSSSFGQVLIQYLDSYKSELRETT